jgi:hypothetical protein
MTTDVSTDVLVSITDVCADVSTDVSTDILLVGFTLNIPHALLVFRFELAPLLEIADSTVGFRPKSVTRHLPSAVASPVNRSGVICAENPQLSEHPKYPFTVTLREGCLSLAPPFGMFRDVSDASEHEAAVPMCVQF